MKEDSSSQSQIEPRASGGIAFAVLCMLGELAHTGLASLVMVYSADSSVIKVSSETSDVFSRGAFNVWVSNTAQIYIVRERYNGLRRPRPSGGVSQLMLRAMWDGTTRI